LSNRKLKKKKLIIPVALILISIGFFIAWLLNFVPLESNNTEPDGGSAGLPLQSVINITGNAELAAFPNKTGSGTPADPYVIKNLTINPGASEWGFYISYTNKNLEIRNCTINGIYNSSYGIYIQDSSNITVVNCTFKDHTSSIYVISSSNVLIVNNSIKHNSIDGIYFSVMNNSIIASNHVSNNLEYGIYVKWSYNISISENFATDNDWSGIRLRWTTYNKISKNTVLYSGEYGINCYRTSFTVVTQNNVLKNNADGIYMKETNFAIVSQNNGSNNGYSGIQITSSNNSIIIDNIGLNNNRGLKIYRSKNVSINGNTLLNNRKFDLYIDKSFITSLSGNIFNTFYLYPAPIHVVWLILEFGIFFILLFIGLYYLISDIKKRREMGNKIQAEFNVAYSLFLIANSINQLFHILSKVIILYLLEVDWLPRIIREYLMYNFIEIVIGSYIFSLELQVAYTLLLFLVAFLFIMYPTEKYLKKSQKIPYSTFILIAISLLSLVILIAHFFPDTSQITGFQGFMLSILHIITFFAILASLIFGITGFLSYYIAISIKTVGKHRKIAILTLIGFGGWGVAKLIDSFFNRLDEIAQWLILMGPILFIVFTPLLRFRRIMPSIINFYQNQRRCVVHRGVIEGKVFLCSKCNVFYCLKCKEALIDIENKCWNCGASIEKTIIERPESEIDHVATDLREDSDILDVSTNEITPSEPGKRRNEEKVVIDEDKI
jgi:parallel beta-helix repeat protein